MELSKIGDEDRTTVGTRLASVDRRTWRLRFYVAIIVLDLLAVTGGFSLAGLWRFGDPVHLQAVTLVVVVLPIFLALSGPGLSAEVLADWRSGLFQVIGSLLSATAVVLFVGFYLRSSAELSRALMIAGILLSSLLLVILRSLIGALTTRVFRGYPISRLLITDGVEVTAPGVERFHANMLGLTDNDSITEPFVLDRLSRCITGFDSVIIACQPERRGAWATAIKGSNVRAELLVPELQTIGAIGCERFAGLPTVLISTGPLRDHDELAKRALDVTLSLAALLFLAPLLLFVAIAIRIDSRGPVLFVQQRVGRGNRLFSVYKFRSMYARACDSNGNVSTTRDDDRVTRVGRFIRATSIDELPQLFNILRGEMSFVGPRPHALGSLAGDQLFWEVDRQYSHRHACKPGLTGLAQIRGFRGATHRREDLVNRLQADLEYVNGWSVWRDISIMLTTVRVLVHRNAF